MKKALLFLLSSAFILPAFAAELASESFDYPAGDIIGQEGGAGWSGGWYVGNDPFSGTKDVISESLTFSDYPVAGGALQLTMPNEASFTEVRIRRDIGFDFEEGQDLWVSFLYKQPDAPLDSTASRTAEIRSGPSLSFRMRAKNSGSQGTAVGYDTEVAANGTKNIQDGRTYLFVCRFGDLGMASGKKGIMFVIDEPGYADMMADGILAEDDLNTYRYLYVEDEHAEKSLNPGDYVDILVADSSNTSFSAVFDEIRYGTSLQDVIPDNTKASDPSPDWGETNVKTNIASLTWTPAAGVDANGQHVYFGTDRTAVETATTAAPMGVYMGAQDSSSFALSGLELGTRYFWRVDQVIGGVVSTGYVWDFWTFGFADVDNFDFYTDQADLRTVWDDYIVNDSGSTIDVDTAVFYQGGKSLEYLYESQYGESIATKNYAQAQDWSVEGVLLVMDIWFRGTAGNSTSETMFVTIEGSTTSATVSYPDSSALASEEWTLWHIPVSDFAGVDLSDVRKFSIGFTDGGSDDGVVYFDSIAVYPCRPGSLAADINDDCTVDMADIAVMATEWLSVQYY
jgi:hypothetical protein